MIKTYATKANAKINIFLKVCGKYPNGYHRLYMLMQEIDLADDIKVAIDPDRVFDIELICPGTNINPKKNLCYRAAAKFYEALAAKLREEGNDCPEDSFGFTEITAVKNIPSEAGLGGGSSDAAAILKVLQKHYGYPFDMEKMVDMASSLGADVPFFLYGHTAICEGIGEKVTVMPSLTGLPIILIKPSEGVSTAACFMACDATPIVFDEEGYKALMNGIFADGELKPADRVIKAAPDLTNDLEAPALDEVPKIGTLIEAIRETDCIYAAMSGSGSTAFGIYADEDAAAAAFTKLKNDPRTNGCGKFKVTAV